MTPFEWFIVGSAAAGFFGSIFSTSSANSTNVKLQEQTNKLNYQMFQEQMDYDWTKTQYQSNYMQQLMDRYNEYMKPTNLMARYRDAGINPFVAGSSALGQSQTQMPTTFPTGGSPSAVPAETARVNPLLSANDVSSSILQLAQANKEVHEGKNLDANSNRTKTLLGEELKEKIIDNQTKTFDYELKVKFGDSEKIQQINTMISEEFKNYAMADMYDASIDEIESKIKANLAKADLDAAEAERINEQIPWIAKEMSAKLGLLKAQTFAANQQGNYYIAAGEQARAAAFKDYQEGKKAVAETQTINDLRDVQVSFEKSRVELNEWQARKLAYDIYDSAIHLGIDKSLADQTLKQMEIAIKNGQLHYANEMASMMQPLFGVREGQQIVGTAAGSVRVR